jgi:hypothetical protein
MMKIYVKVIMGFLVWGLIGCASGPQVDLSGVTTYYVSADGYDKNSGIKEDDSFETLETAFKQAVATNIKTITVIGELPVDILKLKDTGDKEILVTGKDGAKLLLSTATQITESHRIQIRGKSKVRFTNLEITSAKETLYMGFVIEAGAEVTFGTGLRISKLGDSSWPQENPLFGGAVDVAAATLIMEGDASISECGVNAVGGGINAENSTIILRDDASITGCRAAIGGGGLCARLGSTVTIQDNVVISNNTSVYGAGLFIQDSKGTITGDVRIEKNNAAWGTTNSQCYGAGMAIYSNDGQTCTVTVSGNVIIQENGARLMGGGVIATGKGTVFTLQDNAVITKNSATIFGGGGVWHEEGAKFNQEGGSVTGNTGGEILKESDSDPRYNPDIGTNE